VLRENPSREDLTAMAERFLRLKQDLGMQFRRGAVDLRDFVCELAGRGIHRPAELSAAVVDDWRALVATRGASQERGRIRVVAEFLGHLEVLGRAPAFRLAPPPFRRLPEYRPYIFDVQELRLSFARADLPGEAQDRAVAYSLLYACGLRVAEAARLRIRDVDFEAGTLFVECGKSNRDRLLPLHPRMAERLLRHRAGRRGGVPAGAAFFVDAAGRAYTPGRLSGSFRGDLTAWGMDRPTEEKGGFRYGSPRAHALRHSFAIHRLLQWYRAGADVQAKLPILSTYLGHAHLRETQVYLKTTGLLLREAQTRFAGRWDKEFPLEP
jgi:integrase